MDGRFGAIRIQVSKPMIDWLIERDRQTDRQTDK